MRDLLFTAQIEYHHNKTAKVFDVPYDHNKGEDPIELAKAKLEANGITGYTNLRILSEY